MEVVRTCSSMRLMRLKLNIMGIAWRWEADNIIWWSRIHMSPILINRTSKIERLKMIGQCMEEVNSKKILFSSQRLEPPLNILQINLKWCQVEFHLLSSSLNLANLTNRYRLRLSSVHSKIWWPTRSTRHQALKFVSQKFKMIQSGSTIYTKSRVAII